MGRIDLNPDLRLRPVPEMDICLAYLRHPPRLLRLNLEAWALLETVETCAGLERPEAAILRLLDDCGWSLSEDDLQRMLEPLEQQGLLLRSADADDGSDPCGQRPNPKEGFTL